MRLLCIEDEAPLREDIVEYLRLQNLDVDEAGGGEEAIAKMQKTPYDLILCDIKMPRVTGYDVLRHARSADERMQAVPFVFLTALSDREDWMRGHEWGCDAYLTKPIDFAALHATVKSRIERQRVVEHLFTSMQASMRNQVSAALTDSLLSPINDLRRLSEYLLLTAEHIRPDRLQDYLEEFHGGLTQQTSVIECILESLSPTKSIAPLVTPVTLAELAQHIAQLTDIAPQYDDSDAPDAGVMIDLVMVGAAINGLVKAANPILETTPVIRLQRQGTGCRITVADHPFVLQEEGGGFFRLDARTDLALLAPATRKRLVPLMFAGHVVRQHTGWLELKQWESDWLGVAMVLADTSA